MSALWPLQVAMVDRWREDEAVWALVEDRIYDGMQPADAEYPFARIEGVTESPRNAFGSYGYESTATVKVFSRPLNTLNVSTSSEALSIVRAMDMAVREPLTVEGFGSVRLRPESLSVIVETDGITRQASRRYRAFSVER